MLTPNLLRRIRRIALRSHRLVQNAFSGAYQSIYKGRGLSFASVRPYIAGDDVRSIDWKVSARAGQTYIKEHIEERELTLLILIDGSASVLFGTQDKQKREFAAELGAVLAYTANSNNDKAGLLIFSDKVEHYIAPKKGKNHLLRLIRDLLTVETSGRGTDLSLALRTVNRLLRQGAIVFVISDFLMDVEAYQKDLIITSKRHETIAIVLSDPLEESIPDVGMMRLQDAETGAVEWVDTSSAEWQKQFKAQHEALATARDKAFQKAGVAQINMPPDSDYVRALSLFFQQQARKRAR
jgi:uncharacterized protein (DUF58 family)